MFGQPENFAVEVDEFFAHYPFAQVAHFDHDDDHVLAILLDGLL
jgi:hypothetical protein